MIKNKLKKHLSKRSIKAKAGATLVELIAVVCILSIEDKLDDQEFKIAKIASDFLGKQLEA